MSANDYDMPMSPKPERTAVGNGTATNIPVPPGGARAVRPKGLIELRDQAGTMVGDLTRTSTGLTVHNAFLKAADSDNVRDFKHPVFVPWGGGAILEHRPQRPSQWLIRWHPQRNRRAVQATVGRFLSFPPHRRHPTPTTIPYPPPNCYSPWMNCLTGNTSTNGHSGRYGGHSSPPPSSSPPL